MHNFHPELYLINIMVSIDKIIRNTKNISCEEFVESETTFGFVTRELQEIGETINKLLKGNFFSIESKEEWKRAVNLRNVIVHRYFGIHPDIVWEIIKKDIPQIKNRIMNIIKQYEKKTVLLQAASDTKKVYKKINRHETVNYIETIEDILKAT